MACGIKTGTVISHPCGRKTATVCSQCGEETCLRHYDQKRKSCVKCSGTYQPEKGVIRVGSLFEFEEDDFAAFEAKQMNDELTYLDS
jgi:hypothetical protein